MNPAPATIREYELKHAGGVLTIAAGSSRQAVEAYLREYGSDWYYCGPKNPIPRVKSIATAAHQIDGAIDKANYDRMVEDEKQWEIPMRGQLTLDMEVGKKFKKASADKAKEIRKYVKQEGDIF